ncbi:FHA domain-containing protein [Actinomyces sp.]|uniref:FHA domain-containing protein n=1 Tax=Actinomyces sp. TaxID=29317 RepID=UPI0026DC62B8|nr:FHA domain-containing protein [Actinomyces sp.]MDO4901104.1 FHA domain-containing protein [Actinomyces sp.]
MTEAHGNQWEARWAEGTWTAAVTPRGVLLLPREVPEDLVNQLWRLLRSPEGSLTAILDRLVMGAGGQLSRIPDFALVLTGDTGTHLALRGSPSLRIDGEPLDATSVSTWMEAFLPGSPAVVLAAPEPAGDVLRPAVDAVVRAALLQLGDVDGAAGPAPAEVPAQTSEPVAEQSVPVPEAAPTSAAARVRALEPVEPVAEKPAAIPEPVVQRPVPVPELEPVASPAETGDADASGTAQVTEAVPEATAVAETDSVPQDQDSPASAAQSEERPGDHDGWTVADLPADLVEELGAMLPTSSEEAVESSGVEQAAQTQVPDTEVTRMALSVICPSGHANPTNYVTCRECGAELTQPARIIPCPPLGTVRVSSGGEVLLDRPVLVGREPSAEGVAELDAAAPALITVPSPERVISRNHLLIRLDEWSVLARSLSASNGTVLRRDGVSPMRMSSTEPVLLRSGDILDLGDGQSLLLEDLP